MAISRKGSWTTLQPISTWLCLLLLTATFSVFLYTNGLRRVFFVPRVVVICGFLIVYALIYAPFKLALTNPAVHGTTHPLERIIYDSRVEVGRWLVHVAVSQTPGLALREYRERHGGRDPPRGLEEWFAFATARNSPVVDYFPQIERDLAPFRGLAPAEVKARVRRAASELEGVALVEVKGGRASHNVVVEGEEEGAWKRQVMDDLVDLMKDFVGHLPDMEFAVNLEDRPRVLPPWEDVHRLSEEGKRQMRKKNGVVRRHEDNITVLTPRSQHPQPRSPSAALSARDLATMTAHTCPPGSAVRTTGATFSSIQNLCLACQAPQSKDTPFLIDWPTALDPCHQPDLFRLHGFHLLPPPAGLEPTTEVLPVFGRTKTDSYADVMIPLPLPRGAEGKEEGTGAETAVFDMTYKKLLWRGRGDELARGMATAEGNEDLTRGGQQQRLMHLLNNASSSSSSSSDVVPVVLAVPEQKTSRFRVEAVPAGQLNAALPIDVGVSDWGFCHAPDGEAEDGQMTLPEGKRQEETCALAQHEFGTRPPVDQPLLSRFLVVLDTDTGPAPLLPQPPPHHHQHRQHLLPHALRSAAVPLVATIFRHWYSDRLIPWVHFVPLDLRFQGVHSTLAYFSGLRGYAGDGKDQKDKKKKQQKGGLMRDPKMAPRTEEARWIAEEGRRWAGKALRREDEEAYLYRVLVEWAGIVGEGDG